MVYEESCHVIWKDKRGGETSHTVTIGNGTPHVRVSYDEKETIWMKI